MDDGVLLLILAKAVAFIVCAAAICMAVDHLFF